MIKPRETEAFCLKPRAFLWNPAGDGFTNPVANRSARAACKKRHSIGGYHCRQKAMEKSANTVKYSSRPKIIAPDKIQVPVSETG